jgi:integrase
VAVETATAVTLRPYPKSRAGVRMIPLPDFLLSQLTAHRELALGNTEPDPRWLVFLTRNGTPQRRSNFHRQIWRPALIRAGLLGEAEAVAGAWWATWPDSSGATQRRKFPTEREALAHVAEHASGGLRFHDLRHSYATWLEMSRIASGASFGKISELPPPATSPLELDHGWLAGASLRAS